MKSALRLTFSIGVLAAVAYLFAASDWHEDYANRPQLDSLEREWKKRNLADQECGARSTPIDTAAVRRAITQGR